MKIIIENIVHAVAHNLARYVDSGKAKQDFGHFINSFRTDTQIFCNNLTPSGIYLAIAYKIYGVYYSKGWWKIPPLQEARISMNKVYKGELFIHAYNDEKKWEGEFEFAVALTPFDYIYTVQNDYKDKRKFYSINVTNGVNRISFS